MRNTKLKQMLEDGMLDAINEFKKLKADKKALDEREKILLPYVLEEINSNGGTVQKEGFMFTSYHSATRLDYSGNEDWRSLNDKIEALKKQMKPIEDKMKTAYNNGCSMVDNDTGEVFEPAKYKSGGKETIRITKG